MSAWQRSKRAPRVRRIALAGVLALALCTAFGMTLAVDDPDATLLRPFAGTANLIGMRNGDLGPLSIFNGVAMRGTWTFRAWDTNGGNTSTLNNWGLQITAERPVK